MTKTARRPLDGVRIVEVATYVSAPFGSQMLADLGAEVIKIEPPRGDPFRRFGRPAQAMGAVFVNVNGGKRSIVLDLKDPTDQARVRALVAHADVFLANWRPGVADRLGLGDADLAAANPRLIRVYVTGYGPDGPEADKPAFDSVIQARSGLTWLEGSESEPRLVSGYMVDKTTASFVAQTMLAALYERTRTGEGREITVSMLDVMAYMNFPEHLLNRTFVDDEPDDPRNPGTSVTRPIRALDGWILVVPVSGDQVRRSLEAVGEADKVAEILGDRDTNRMTRTLLSTIESHTRTQPRHVCVEWFEKADVPVSPCNSPDEHFADPQVLHSGVYRITEHPELGKVREVRYPARSQSWEPLHHRSIAPLLDADRDEVLRGLGS